MGKGNEAREGVSTSAGSQGVIYQQRKQNASVLASQYTAGKRIGEIVSIIAFCILFGITLSNIWEHIRLQNSWILFTSCALSMTVADLVSGLVHWGADTWGTLQTPFVGTTFIRSFREHHVDPFRITCHDFIEANGDNCLTVLIPLFALSFIKIPAANTGVLFIVSFLVFAIFWISLTNQLHKFAHMIKPPSAIALLQDWRVILSRRNHQIHHHNPFDRYYCITTGWLNPVLGSIAFWKRMEILLTATTGAIPRQDDARWTLQLAQ